MSRAKPSITSEIHDLIGWVSRARCRSYSPALFDAPIRDRHGRITPDDEQAIEQAKAVCLECPVMMQCLRHAVTYGCADAVYGGLTDAEREDWAARELVSA